MAGRISTSTDARRDAHKLLDNLVSNNKIKHSKQSPVRELFFRFFYSLVVKTARNLTKTNRCIVVSRMKKKETVWNPEDLFI